MSSTEAERLRDILPAIDAIARAEALLARDPGDPDLVEAVLAAARFHVFTIGEAVEAPQAELTRARPDVPWEDIARMRDLIGHHYYRLDPEIVRATIGAPLAALRGLPRTPRRPRGRQGASLHRGALGTACQSTIRRRLVLHLALSGYRGLAVGAARPRA